MAHEWHMDGTSQSLIRHQGISILHQAQILFSGRWYEFISGGRSLFYNIVEIRGQFQSPPEHPKIRN
jgi:hypothetical protein